MGKLEGVFIMKPRYDILDGLRGIAAICVLVSHLFEAIAFANGDAEQNFFHGFLAVDFFFILSGFVMGYAYDNRWKDSSVKIEGSTMGFWGFCKRRLIRLHPMAMMGCCLGLLAFAIQGFTDWNGAVIPMSQIALCFFLGLLMLPSPANVEVRGNTEIFPLNGPHWSLFFEYCGSILYALFLRKLPTKWLRVWVVVAGIFLVINGIWQGEGTIGYGWSSEPNNMMGGALRLLFGYPLGLLLARLFREKKPGTLQLPIFAISALVLVALLIVPSLSTLTNFTPANPLYQCFCAIVAFPAIVWFGARGVVSGIGKNIAVYLGRLSYPLYAIHYPLIYLYIHWINTNQHPFGQQAWCTPVAITIVAITIATICFRFYDEPLRRWLNKKMQ